MLALTNRPPLRRARSAKAEERRVSMKLGNCIDPAGSVARLVKVAIVFVALSLVTGRADSIADLVEKLEPLFGRLQ